MTKEFCMGRLKAKVCFNFHKAQKCINSGIDYWTDGIATVMVNLVP